MKRVFGFLLCVLRSVSNPFKSYLLFDVKQSVKNFQVGSCFVVSDALEVPCSCIKFMRTSLDVSYDATVFYNSDINVTGFRKKLSLAEKYVKLHVMTPHRTIYNFISLAQI